MDEKPPPRRVKRKTQVAVVRTESPRMHAWMAGDLKAEDLTDDEVFKMQLMDSDGHFRGRPPRMIPRELAEAFRSEAQKRLMGWFVEQIPTAQKAYTGILTAHHLLPGDTAKLKAAEGIFDRVIGKVGNETHITVDKGKTFEDFVGDALVDVEEDE